MSGGGGGGPLWIIALVAGTLMCGLGYVLEHNEVHGVIVPALLALGGLAVVFGSCEAMIRCVEGLGQRMHWNDFVAGTMAGLASNFPEVVMIAFVVLKAPRVAFVLVVLTLHVSALVFGIYSGIMRRDTRGQARLPEALVKLSTDLYACAAGVFLATGALMLVLHAFDAGDHEGDGLGAGDLYAIGGALLFVEVVNIMRLVQRFSGNGEGEGEGEGEPAPAEPAPAPAAAATTEGQPATATAAAPADHGDMPGWGPIVFFGVLGTIASVIGGHAVGEFADSLVNALTERGYSEMFGAILLSVFACSGAFLMLATAHFKGKFDVAIANVSGQVTQVPFVVLPIVLILMAAFAQLDMIPRMEYGAVLPIDFETTLVMLFGFPTMLIMWKSIQDDGKINWLETASMTSLFALNIYLLAQHG